MNNLPTYTFPKYSFTNESYVIVIQILIHFDETGNKISTAKDMCWGHSVGARTMSLLLLSLYVFFRMFYSFCLCAFRTGLCIMVCACKYEMKDLIPVCTTCLTVYYFFVCNKTTCIRFHTYNFHKIRVL